MGSACLPLWCNLYLAHYEISFIQRLAKLGRSDLMARFLHAKSYIDDFCWFNFETPSQFLDPTMPRTAENPFWIYPLNVVDIEVEVTNFKLNPKGCLVGTNAHFLSFNFCIDDLQTGAYNFTKYDKRRDLPFHISQFIHLQSNRSIAQAYKVILSQLFAIPYICSTLRSALHEVQVLLNAFIGNGFQKARLLRTICQFLETNVFPGCYVDVDCLAAILASREILIKRN